MDTTDLTADEWEVLLTAFHELGHALARHVGGLNVDHCRIERRPDSGIDGWTEGEDPTVHDSTAKIDAHLVNCFAGEAAEVRALLELTELSAEDARARAALASAHDYAAWLTWKEHGSLTEDEARARAQAMVDEHWEGITGLVDQLVREGHLNRWQLERGWAASPV